MSISTATKEKIYNEPERTKEKIFNAAVDLFAVGAFDAPHYNVLVLRRELFRIWANTEP